MKAAPLRGAVIGDPVSHSLSPLIFSLMSDVLGAGLDYQAVQVSAQELPQFIEKARSEFVGLSVTIPHKQSVAKWIDELSPEAKVVGAVNVIAFKNGKARGLNTDVIGIKKSLELVQADLKHSRVLCLGAGGAARAVAYVLAHAGCREFVVLNKTPSNAASFVKSLSTAFPDTVFRAISDVKGLEREQSFSIVVNATPLGMKTSSQKSLDYFESVMSQVKGALAFDLIYTPAETDFMKVSWSKGFRVFGGLEMLIQQALAAWEIWFTPIGSRRVEIETLLRNELSAALTPRDNLYLSGFMGVGKSTIARMLAEKIGWDFVDTDHWIEQKTGKKVSQIFQELGEKAFRQYEKEAIEELSGQSRLVVALGGGVLTHPENLERIKNSGTLIYLEASVESLLERLKTSYERRPLLKDSSDLRKTIVDLLKIRAPIYEQSSWKIATDGQEPEEIAAAISDRIAK
jgi:shikimate dehydrogenase